MFGRRFDLFTILGFRVGLDLSWVLLAVLVTWSLATGLYPFRHEGLSVATYWAMGAASALLLFASIVFHELAHSLVARRYDIPIRGITLFIFGGVAEMEREPGTPRAEFLMAVAGPIASLLLAGAFWGTGLLAREAGLPLPVWACAYYLALINAILAGFNMLPAFPLDGGRAFRAFLWHRKGDLTAATRTAAGIGAAVGIAFMVMGGVFAVLFGNLIGGIWWFLIGLFLRGAATGAVSQMQATTWLTGVPVRRFMTPDPVTVPPDMPVAVFVQEVVYDSHHDLYPVAVGDRPVGAVTVRALHALPRERRDIATVSTIMEPLSAGNSIEASADAMEAMSLMRTGNRSRLLVTERGRLVGLVTLKDMLRVIALRAELEPEE